MDKYGSFVWHAIDDEKDVHQLSKEMESEFPKMEKSLSRLIKFLDDHERQQPDLLERRGEKIMLECIPYVLMFAVAIMIIYGWGLWRTMHQKQDTLQHALFKRNLQTQKSAQKK